MYYARKVQRSGTTEYSYRAVVDVFYSKPANGDLLLIKRFWLARDVAEVASLLSHPGFPSRNTCILSNIQYSTY
jgi:hypothetical protein